MAKYSKIPDSQRTQAEAENIVASNSPEQAQDDITLNRAAFEMGTPDHRNSHTSIGSTQPSAEDLNAEEEEDKLSSEELTGEDNVSPLERDLLQRSAEETPGDLEAEDRRSAALDDTDNEGEKLNEENLETDQWAQDMDFPELTSDETDYSPDQV